MCKFGIDVFCVFDLFNYEDNFMFGIDVVRNVDGVVEVIICYIGDVSDLKKIKYMLDYYVDFMIKFVEYGIDVFVVKDMVGLLKSRVATMLIFVIRVKFFDLFIYVYIYDIVLMGVVFMFVVVVVGVDVVDVCMDVMVGMMF